MKPGGTARGAPKSEAAAEQDKQGNCRNQRPYQQQGYLPRWQQLGPFGRRGETEIGGYRDRDEGDRAGDFKP